jgi:hypothetical protein
MGKVGSLACKTVGGISGQWKEDSNVVAAEKRYFFLVNSSDGSIKAHVPADCCRSHPFFSGRRFVCGRFRTLMALVGVVWCAVRLLV